jgi:hypothetical protein
MDLASIQTSLADTRNVLEDFNKKMGNIFSKLSPTYIKS